MTRTVMTKATRFSLWAAPFLIVSITFLGFSLNLNASDSSSDISDHNLPSCESSSSIPPKTCSKEGLPNLVFVVGVEGSGHHLLQAVLKDLTNYVHRDFAPWLHLYRVHNKLPFSLVVNKSSSRERLVARLGEALALAKKKGLKGLVITLNSFPLGHSDMFATARPDLVTLKQFDCDLYNLKLIVVRRHPLLSVYSVVRRYGSRYLSYFNISEPVDGIPQRDLPYLLHARVVEDELTYLNQQITLMDCPQVLFLNHMHIINHAENELKRIATFIDVDFSELSLSSDPPVKTTVQVPPECRRCLERVLYDFFEERKQMWPLLNT